MKHKYLCLLAAVLLSTFSLKAQESSSFEGVWDAVKQTLVIKSIKIQDIGDNKLLVMFKTKDGIEQKEVKKPSGNSLIVTFIDEVNYGKWRLGYNDRRDDYIIGMEGSESAGYATEIYVRDRYATIEYEYIRYKLVLENGNIHMYYTFYSDYTDDYQIVLFKQSSKWGDAGIYTNW